MTNKNLDAKTVESFGDEWKRYNQSSISKSELKRIFDDYFHIFPKEFLHNETECFDMGCGSGRWAQFIAPKVRRLNCIDPSDAINVAQTNLGSYKNVKFFKASLDDDVLLENTQDFGYSLGVLHHVPDTQEAIRSCVKYLKPGSPLLLYLYYDFDNRSWLYRSIWKLTDLLRRIIILLPASLKDFVTNVIAIFIYFPLARISKLLDAIGINTHFIPLSYYKDTSFYTMRTDARDRFGTPLERRFSRKIITKMMLESGLTKIKFSDNAPYWCVIGFKE